MMHTGIVHLISAIFIGVFLFCNTSCVEQVSTQKAEVCNISQVSQYVEKCDDCLDQPLSDEYSGFLMDLWKKIEGCNNSSGVSGLSTLYSPTKSIPTSVMSFADKNYDFLIKTFETEKISVPSGDSGDEERSWQLIYASLSLPAILMQKINEEDDRDERRKLIVLLQQWFSMANCTDSYAVALTVSRIHNAACKNLTMINKGEREILLNMRNALSRNLARVFARELLLLVNEIQRNKTMDSKYYESIKSHALKMIHAAMEIGENNESLHKLKEECDAVLDLEVMSEDYILPVLKQFAREMQVLTAGPAQKGSR